MKKIIGAIFLAMLLADVVILTTLGPVMIPAAQHACDLLKNTLLDNIGH